MGVNTAEMRTIKRILSAILHLGNVSFKNNGEGVLPTVDGDKARQHMEWACELLGIDKVCSGAHTVRCVQFHLFWSCFGLVFVPFVEFHLLWAQVQFETWMCSWKIGSMVVPRPHSEVETCRETIAKLLCVGLRFPQ